LQTPSCRCRASCGGGVPGVVQPDDGHTEPSSNRPEIPVTVSLADRGAPGEGGSGYGQESRCRRVTAARNRDEGGGGCPRARRRNAKSIHRNASNSDQEVSGLTGAVQGHCSQRSRFALALARFTPTHFPFVKLN
jgi:hypothetical protein